MTDSSTLGGAEPRSRAAGHASGAEIDQARATLEVLHGAAALLQGAVEQRESLLSEIASAEQALAEILQKHLRAEHALTAAHDKLERTVREAEHAERLRAELVQGIVELEQRRDALNHSTGVAPTVEYALPAIVAAPPPVLAAPVMATAPAPLPSPSMAEQLAVTAKLFAQHVPEPRRIRLPVPTQLPR